MSESKTYTDNELLYAATARCRCGSGLAYPLDTAEALELGAWTCAAALKYPAPPGEHDGYDFRFYSIESESSINNRPGNSTRPAGTIARTVGYAACPQCAEEWMSEPYDARGAGHHWYSGACPNCGYAVGSGGIHRSGEGEAIRVRYKDVVLATEIEEVSQ